MAFPNGWSYYKAITVSGAAASGYPLDFRVWKNKPLLVDFDLDSRADAECYVEQGVATDGTHWYTTGTDANTDMNLTKWSKSGDTFTEVAQVNCTSDGPADHAQVNGIHYDPTSGLLYVGANNYSTTPKKGYIFRYDPSDLSFVDYVAVRAAWSEGCTIMGGYMWVVYDDDDDIDRYTITNAAEGSFAVSFQETHTHPNPISSPTGGHIWNGITAYGDILYINAHDPDDRIDAFLWDGTDLLLLAVMTPPNSNCGQGLFCDANGDFWFAEREYASGDARILKASLTVHAGDVGLDGNCEDDFSDVRITNSDGSSVLCGDGAGWRENYDSGLFGWFHFALPSTLSTSLDFRVYYGNASPGTWSDDPTDVTTKVEDFESNTVGAFDGNQGSPSASASSSDPLEGTYHEVQTGSGAGVYPTTDGGFVDGNLKRITAYIKYTSAQAQLWAMKTVSGTTRRRAWMTIDNSGVYAANYTTGTLLTTRDSTEYARVEILYDYTNQQFGARCWLQRGAGQVQGTAITSQSTSDAARTYQDVMLYQPGKWDLVFSRDLASTEPTFGDWGAETEPPVGGTRPQGPLGHPFRGAFGGPI